MGTVVMLQPRERISRDLERLLAVGDSCGVIPAAVDVEMEEMAETLSRLAVAYRSRRLDEVAVEAQMAAEHARKLGLNRAFRVAHAVAALAQSTRSVELSANVARLMRLGDAALTSVWEYTDARS